MTLATALREGSFCPQPYIPFQAAMREQTGCGSNEKKVFFFYHISPQGSQSPTRAVLRRRGETWMVV